jgi:hypothetical protein
MAYFTKFPVVKDYEINGKVFDLMDITRRTGFSENIKNNPAFYIEHYIQDGETPIVLADRMYDDADLYWIIMIFNDIYDIDNDWPMDQVSLNEMVNRVYTDPYEVRHFESIETGAVVDDTWPIYDKAVITHFGYEIEKNDAKRKIKIPTPEAVTELVREHNRLISK